MSGGSLRVSDGDRDRVVQVLHHAYAAGRISDDEHSERTAAAVSARTFDDLLPLTADLVPTPVVSPPRAAPPAATVVPGGPDRITAAMSEVKRTGQWVVRRRSEARVVLGSVKLDLTEATFEAALVEIEVTQVAGSLFLRLPEGTTVRDETTNVLGETSVRGLGRPDPALPTVVVRGTNVLGEIKIRGPRRASLWWRAS